MKKLVLAGIIVFFSFSLGFAWYVWDHFVNRPNSNSSQEVIYEVMPGLSFTAVAKNLEKQGLVKNAELFSFYARLRGEAGKMKVGEYLFRRNMRPSEVLGILVSGKSIEYKLTIPEGYNIYEIALEVQDAGLMKADEFLKLVKDPALVKNLLGESHASLEGYLFPETYVYTKYTGVKNILAQMVQNFNINYDLVMKQSTLQGWSKNQIVTLASIIEKETGAGFERPLVSSVFHNRMNKGMLLQTDPTIIYGIADETGSIPKNIRKVDILRPTKYNTYVIKGLPPGPIANPGRDALLAAVKPTVSEFLFFVSYNDGTHKFSKDYNEHAAAVRKYQMKR